MRRATVLAGSLVLVLTIGACSNGKSGSDGEKAAASTTAAPATSTTVEATTTTLPGAVTPEALYQELSAEIERACSEAVQRNAPPTTNFNGRWAEVSTPERLQDSAQKCYEARTGTVLRGNAEVTWFLSKDLESGGATTCADVKDKVAVQVRDESGAVIVVAALGEPKTVSEASEALTHSITCDFPYEQSIQEVPVVKVVLVDPAGEQDLDTVTVTAADLDKTIPRINTFYSCTLANEDACGFQ